MRGGGYENKHRPSSIVQPCNKIKITRPDSINNLTDPVFNLDGP